MIKLQNLTKEELNHLGVCVGQAFLTQEGVYTSSLSEKDVVPFFQVVSQVCYEYDCLYTTSCRHEGFAAFWLKRNAPGVFFWKRLACLMMRRVSLSGLLRLLRRTWNWRGFVTRYREEDYVGVFLIAVSPEYQGQGVVRQLLEAPFSLADQLGIPCVLDTDAPHKAAMYQHCGMTLTHMSELPYQTSMYTLEYAPHKKAGT